MYKFKKCSLYKIIFCFVLPIMFMNSESLTQSKNHSEYKKILIAEIKRHPNSQIQDIYKFIHQASFGSEHAVNDTATVKKWMNTEVLNLDYSVKDQLLDNLYPNANLVRVNLRPYLKKRFDIELLLQAFIKTANSYRGSDSTFNLFWEAAGELAKSHRFIFDDKNLDKYFQRMSDKGFPAVHHSKEYSMQYKPAYRVVDLNYLPNLLNLMTE